MIFFVIAASIMAVCIISIHKLAKHFDVELPLASLVLCGCSALLINFFVISVTPFLTKTYYYIVGSMVLFAAAGTTCYNKYLLYRKTRLAGADILPHVEMAAEYAAQQQPAAAVRRETAYTPQQAEESMQEETFSASAGQPAEAEVAASREITTADDKIKKADITAPPDAPSEAAAPPIFEEAARGTPDSEALPADEKEAEGDGTGCADDGSEADKACKADDVCVEDTADVICAADGSDAADTAGIEASTEDVPEDLAQQLAELSTMDQLLDFAFEQRLQLHRQQALKAYEAALSRYRTDSYAPFIVIEITNICKSLGQYAAAADCFRDAMDIPAIQADAAIRQQFEDSIRYLEIVQEVLRSARLPALPLDDIPQNYMSQIESIYTSRKSR